MPFFEMKRIATLASYTFYTILAYPLSPRELWNNLLGLCASSTGSVPFFLSASKLFFISPKLIPVLKVSTVLSVLSLFAARASWLHKQLLHKVCIWYRLSNLICFRVINLWNTISKVSFRVWPGVSFRQQQVHLTNIRFSCCRNSFFIAAMDILSLVLLISFLSSSKLSSCIYSIWSFLFPAFRIRVLSEIGFSKPLPPLLLRILEILAINAWTSQIRTFVSKKKRHAGFYLLKNWVNRSHYLKKSYLNVEFKIVHMKQIIKLV